MPSKHQSIINTVSIQASFAWLHAALVCSGGQWMLELMQGRTNPWGPCGFVVLVDDAAVAARHASAVK